MGSFIIAPNAHAVQPPPFSTPGSWTIATLDGTTASGYLPSWAEDDPSETDVPPEMLPVRLAHISHRTFHDGQLVRMLTPYSPDEPEEEVVFEASIDCAPYDPDPAQRLPVANVQPCPGYCIPGLGPAGVADIAVKLRALADLFDHTVRPALITAREDWAKRYPEVPGLLTRGTG